jgi:basic membrane lipoprotein Med (substrate-binding protein (PBP1-ABC) superfamily)
MLRMEAKRMNFRRFSYRLLLILAALLLAACGQGGETTPTPTNAAVIPPTETPTQIPGRAMLLSSAESDATLAAEAEAMLQAYAGQQGWVYERSEALDPAAEGANLQVLVVLAPDPGVGTLAAALPETRIVAVGMEAEGANVQSLQFGEAAEAQAAFVAGYTAAAVTDDWRVGVLYGPGEGDLAQAFVVGAEFFCGACAPPYTDYPQAAQGDPGNWQTGVDALLSEAVRTVYLTPAMEIPEIELYLANWGTLLIGNSAPTSEAAGQWLATVGADPAEALRQQLPQALAGQQVGSGGGGIALSNVNADYLGAGRQAHIQSVIDDLAAGYIAIPGD